MLCCFSPQLVARWRFLGEDGASHTSTLERQGIDLGHGTARGR
jgi:hypothetical protein